MKIQTIKKVHNFYINDIQNIDLDPITVFFTLHGKGRSEVTIVCWGQAWSFYWSSMGCNLKEFFTRADNYYLAKKFMNGDTTEDDYESFARAYPSEILKLRKEWGLTKDEAASLWDAQDDIKVALEEGDLHTYQEELCQVFGDDWYECIPRQYTSDHNYLCKILDVVRQAFILSDDSIYEGN